MNKIICTLCGGLAGKAASRWRYKDGSIHVVCEKCLEAEPEKNFERGLDWIFERIQDAAKKR